MKIHRNLCEAVVQALVSIFQEGHYADQVIEKTLRQNKSWGSRDRRFIAEFTYDMVRWHRAILETAPRQDEWTLLGTWLLLKDISLPEWKEFEGLNSATTKVKWEEIQKTRVLRESIPDWLDELGASELGAAWDTELAALNQQAEVVLRVNTLKTSLDSLQQRLHDEHVETRPIPGHSDALVLVKRQHVFQLPSFKEGWFEVQDAGSQQIAAFLHPEPGECIIDACAGAGGKTLHLGALMKNNGRILALDTDEGKLQELTKRGERAGITIIETQIIQSLETIQSIGAVADRLLLDVPCSGLGVLKRNPDAKWKLTPAFMEEVQHTQQEILENYSALVKPGGCLVYATCSILPVENEKPVSRFLEKHQTHFTLVEEKNILPSEGFDGFYMAFIRRI